MSDCAIEYFNGTFPKDLFHLVTGDRLGSGAARETFVFAPDPSKVIKFETRCQSFQNAIEWDLWQFVKDIPNLAKWYAPCRACSNTGSILLMDRTDPLPRGYAMPKRMPSFLTDLKRDNYGLLNGRLVAHDYGTGPAFKFDATPRKVDWK